MTISSKLLQHIKDLKAKEAAAGISPATAKSAAITKANSNTIVIWGSSLDKEYLTFLKPCVGGVPTLVRLENPASLSQVAMYCTTRGVSKIVCSNLRLLELLLYWEKRAKPSLSNYAGSLFKLPAFDPDGIGDKPPIEIVMIHPLKQLVTVPYMKFLTTRYITKLTKPESWFPATEFVGFDVISPANEESCFNLLSRCFLIAVDIETRKENAAITHISFTGFFFTETKKLRSYSTVLKIQDDWSLSCMRCFCWDLHPPKVFQNGKYDINYLLRFNAPVYNWKLDTATMMHCWLSELPKDLGFLQAFSVREAKYWKDLADTSDPMEYMRYNALDTWATGNAILSMMQEVPAYAWENYHQEFPLLFPCVLAELTGIKRDTTVLAVARAEQEAIIEEKTARLNKILSVPAGTSFNVKSSPQMKSLLKLLGCSDIKSADEKGLARARFRHPFNARIINLVLDIRKARTLIEKYLQVGEKSKEFQGGVNGVRGGDRVLYALNPHGTDTSRLASREHHFWTGLQIQNQPRGKEVKQTYVADDGFFFAEVDLEQAESRDTAYISGEQALIDAVTGERDFHSVNCSAFFGVPYEKIFDQATRKTLDKALRDLAKRVNHGANYNMGEKVLIETMGEDKILEARNLLGLPKFWSLMEVAAFLLAAFHKTYPGIKEYMYKGIILDVVQTGLLSHHRPPNHETFTRRCFGDPTKSKLILNSYVAHPPQSLNAQTLNKAWLSVFNTIAMNPKHAPNFKLCAQIHDSILFQWREGHEYLCDMVAECMEIPVTIRSYKAIRTGDTTYQTFTVPAAIKKGKQGKLARYWSETE